MTVLDLLSAILAVAMPVIIYQYDQALLDMVCETVEHKSDIFQNHPLDIGKMQRYSYVMNWIIVFHAFFISCRLIIMTYASNVLERFMELLRRRFLALLIYMLIVTVALFINSLAMLNSFGSHVESFHTHLYSLKTLYTAGLQEFTYSDLVHS